MDRGSQLKHISIRNCAYYYYCLTATTHASFVVVVLEIVSKSACSIGKLDIGPADDLAAGRHMDDRINLFWCEYSKRKIKMKMKPTSGSIAAALGRK